ncbi:MAG: hypothetical protein R3A79_05190 [Nannocystaceae bacterium]
MDTRWHGIALALLVAGCVGNNPLYVHPGDSGTTTADSGSSTSTSTTAPETTDAETTAPMTVTDPAPMDMGSDGVCGDDEVDDELGEACDDGNTVGWDACGPTCASACGNGVTEGPWELCDAGENNSDDKDTYCTRACAPPPDFDPETSEPTMLGVSERFGLDFGNKTLKECPGAVIGFVGWFDALYTEIAYVKTVCTAIDLAPLGDDPGRFKFVRTGDAIHSDPVGKEPPDTDPLDATCPGDTFLIGATGKMSGMGLIWVQLTCADLIVRPTDDGYEISRGPLAYVEAGDGKKAGFMGEDATCLIYDGSAVATVNFYTTLERVTAFEFECGTYELGW